MSTQTRFSTRAVTAMEMPGMMAQALARPVLALRARRGGRRRFEKAIAGFGERAVQILDADGYLLLVVEDAAEQRRIIRTLQDGPAEIDITAWDRRGDAVPLDRGID
jgi:hypothetical protein